VLIFDGRKKDSTMNAETIERPVETSSEPLFILKQMRDVLGAHVDLVALESRYEWDYWRRLVVVLAICGLLAFSVYILLNIVVLSALVHAGLPLWGACLILIGVYAAAAAFLFFGTVKRDPRAGAPFQGSLAEWQRSLAWIQKRFF
jgi:hypothetical protein